MLAEIFMLKLEANIRMTPTAQPGRDPRFVPLSQPRK